jgi:hypothetical protein
MVPPQNPGAGPEAQDRRNGDRGWNGWPIAASCVPMLAGAAMLFIAHRVGILFMILFTSCTAIMVLLMAGIGHAHRK